MIDVKLIAKSFLNIESMCHKKLQKLCYYFYAWDIVLEGIEKKKITENFQAWVHGPVLPSLYHEYKHYGWDDIPQESEMPEEVSDNDYINELVTQVYRIYGQSSGNELEQLTHEEQPWIVARQDLKPYEPSDNKLDDKVILDFYKKQLES